MKAIVFDVDDTIYDQQVVFDQACRDVFGELKGVSLVDLFKANRYYSDESFDAMGRGEMTKEEMYIYRIKRAMEEFHLPITDKISGTLCILWYPDYSIGSDAADIGILW